MKMKRFKDDTICVMGLGYVGLTLAVGMAMAGFRVIGVEIRTEVLEAIATGKAHFYEPGLDEQMNRALDAGRFQAFKKIPNDWDGTVFIITVGTPLGSDGRARLDMAENVCHEVSCHLKNDDIVIMRSTLKLGTTRKLVLPILDESKKSYDLAFCPERTLEGKALVELRQLPQIVGGITLEATIRAAQLFQYLTSTVVRVSDVETGEMIKLIDNANRDVQFAYANEVARACDVVGISAIEVIELGKLGYPRTNLPMPGPVGGPCLEKDPHILAEGLRELGMEPEMSMAARKINERQPCEVIGHLKAVTNKAGGFATRPIISLLGIAFKGQPATNDLRGTMARPILNQLQINFPDATFRGFDMVVEGNEIKKFGLEAVSTLDAAFDGASLVLILNNHSIFVTMSLEAQAQKMVSPGFIYDFWNCFKVDQLELPQGVSYIALGSHGKSTKNKDFL